MNNEPSTYTARWVFPMLDKNDTAVPYIIEVGTKESGMMTLFWYAVNQLYEDGNPQPLNELAGKQVVDTSGTVHILPDADVMALWAMTQADNTLYKDGVVKNRGET